MLGLLAQSQKPAHFVDAGNTFKSRWFFSCRRCYLGHAGFRVAWLSQFQFVVASVTEQIQKDCLIQFPIGKGSKSVDDVAVRRDRQVLHQCQVINRLRELLPGMFSKHGRSKRHDSVVFDDRTQPIELLHQLLQGVFLQIIRCFLHWLYFKVTCGFHHATAVPHGCPQGPQPGQEPATVTLQAGCILVHQAQPHHWPVHDPASDEFILGFITQGLVRHAAEAPVHPTDGAVAGEHRPYHGPCHRRRGSQRFRQVLPHQWAEVNPRFEVQDDLGSDRFAFLRRDRRDGAMLQQVKVILVEGELHILRCPAGGFDLRGQFHQLRQLAVTQATGLRWWNFVLLQPVSVRVHASADDSFTQAC